MSCTKCEDEPIETFVRILTANVKIVGCEEHLKILLEKLRNTGTVNALDDILEARADELQRIDTANKDNGINFWFEDMSNKNNGWRTMKQYVPERLKQLSKGD